MKQKIKKALMAIVGLLLSTSAFAHDFEVEGFYYNITDNTSKTVAVTFKGNSYNSYSNEYTGAITIPSSVTYSGTTYSVTSIGVAAFLHCPDLTSITIPNSVTEIGDRAFYYCWGLTSVTIPNSVTEIGDYTFYDCLGLTKVTIPNSVTSIGDYTFYNCSGLTELTIPNSVTEIGYFAFYNCSGLTSIVVEDGNNKYDSRNNCNAIIETSTNTLIVGCKNTTIPNSVTSIGVGTFYNCSGLTELTIPNSVTSIGDFAFYYCTGLTKVTIPNSVTEIGKYAFACGQGLTELTIGNSVTSIGDYAFDDCSGLNTIISLNPTPPTCSSSLSFDSKNYSNATLYVPKDSYAKYFIDDVWGLFSNIKNIEITLSQTEVNLPINEKMTLTYTVTPSYTPVEWSTSNPDVAYIKKNADNSVTVVGMADGEAIVTAKATDDSGVSASCKIIVGIGGIEDIEADNNAIEVVRYDIHGRLLSEPTKGINIIKMSDGTTRKEIVKE